MLVSCSDSDNNDRDDVTVLDIARSSENFSILLSVLEQTGLDEVLDNHAETFTVFAPTNAAFESIEAETLEALLDDSDALRDLLLYHVISGTEVDSGTAIGLANERVLMANEQETVLSVTEDVLYVNLSQVTDTDLEADNGIVHVLNSVIFPPNVLDPSPTLSIAEIVQNDESSRFDILALALNTTALDIPLADSDQTFTVFAPTDSAFEALGQGTINALIANTPELAAILGKHVVSEVEIDFLTALTANGSSVDAFSGDQIPVQVIDGYLRIGNANVVFENIQATNGIVHIIDAVIATEEDLPPLSVVQVLQNDPDFSTLLTALEQENLLEVLDNLSSEFTVFAPTNEAFNVLLESLEISVEELLALPNLSDILLYHVLAGTVLFDDAVDSAGQVIETLNEDNIGISFTNDSLNINTAQVIAPFDLTGANGVVHKINQVLIPPPDVVAEGTVVDAAVGIPELSLLVQALSAANLVETLSNDNETFTVFAPTNAAFEALGEGVLENLINSDIESLTNVLLAHVIQGAAVDSRTAFSLAGQSATTLGGDVSINIDDGVLTVGDAQIISFDLLTSNGIIHIVDAVLVTE